MTKLIQMVRWETGVLRAVDCPDEVRALLGAKCRDCEWNRGQVMDRGIFTRCAYKGDPNECNGSGNCDD